MTYAETNLDEAVVIALGGNLALEGGSLQDALGRALSSLPEAGIQVLRRSRWWRSAAWPDPTQPAYLNGVALVRTALAPRQALEALLETEAALGRRRSVVNAPRTVDLDLIAYGRMVIEEPDLVLPHPRAADRLFVMGPLAEIAPAWRHPVLGKTAAELAAAAMVGKDAHPI